MKSFKRLFGKYGWGVAAVGAMSLVCSCGENEEQEIPAEQAATTEQAAAQPAEEKHSEPSSEQKEPEAAPAPTLDDLHEQLFDAAIYTLAKKAASPQFAPTLNSDIKDLLVTLEQYYAELKKDPEAMHDRVRTALLIADMKQDLGAYPKALTAYQNVLEEVKLLTEEERGASDMQRIISLSEGGIGSCLLAQGRAADAMIHYETALGIDETLYGMVAPPEGQALPKGEVAPAVSQAVADLLDSYRCMGDCQRAQEDQEEARATYVKGVKLVNQLKSLSSDMVISYVKLLTQWGNLENAVGKPKEARSVWIMAVRLCQSLYQSTPKLSVKAEIKFCYDSLMPALVAVDNMLRAEQDAQKAQAVPAKQEITTEPINAVAPAADQAAAPEPTIAPEQDKKPAVKQTEERRRKYNSRRRRSRRD